MTTRHNKMAFTIGDLLESKQYQNFIASDPTFPVNGTVVSMRKHIHKQPVETKEDYGVPQSDHEWFIRSFDKFKSSVNDEKTTEIAFEYEQTVQFAQEVGCDVTGTASGKDWFDELLSAVWGWLQLLKVDLMANPLDEKSGRADLLEKEDGTDMTREETVLYLVRGLAGVYKERGWTEALDEWVTQSGIHFQSIVSIPLNLKTLT